MSVQQDGKSYFVGEEHSCKGSRPGRPKSQELRSKVLKEILRACSLYGPYDFSLDMVAREAGVSRIYLYRNWADREAMITEALMNGFSEVRPVPYGFNEGDVLSVLTACYESVSAVSSSLVGQALFAIVTEKKNAQFAKQFQEMFFRFVYDPYIEELTRCKDMGLISDGVDPRQLCWLGIGQGMVHLAVMKEPFALTDARELAKMVARAVEPYGSTA
jgi:AcrR family transcriptional regulator